ncbi:MAG TPA: hypothetical protein VF753_17850 [Terriglobales bacterium]
MFSHLLLWIDENHDGVSQPNELHRLPELGVYSIGLRYKEVWRLDQFGNLFHYRGALNPDPKDGESKDGRWTYDVFLTTLGKNGSSIPSSDLAFDASREGQPAQECGPQGPTSTTTVAQTALGLQNYLFPALKTGIGEVATMGVGPVGQDYDGDQLSEAVVQTSSSCPTNWDICVTSASGFVVGAGGQAHVDVNGQDTKFGPQFAPQENTFYDQHIATDANSDLSGSGLNSCVVECSQTYFWDNQQVGSHVITRTFTLGQQDGTPVTNVTVSKN